MAALTKQATFGRDAAPGKVSEWGGVVAQRVISGSMALSVPRVWERMWDDVVPRNKHLFHQ